MADVAGEARAARMFEAVNALEGRLGRKVSLEELGALVAGREGRPAHPYAASVVRRWLKGLSEPRGLGTWAALAAVLEVDAGWLAFGRAAPAAAPAEERPTGVIPPTMYRDTSAPPDVRAERRKANGGDPKA